jgi:hypothetical protein
MGEGVRKELFGLMIRGFNMSKTILTYAIAEQIAAENNITFSRNSISSGGDYYTHDGMYSIFACSDRDLIQYLWDKGLIDKTKYVLEGI